MFRIKENILKAWITSIIGTVLMVASLVLWITGVIPIKWDATIGLCIGVILLMAPQKIETIAITIAKRWTGSTEQPTQPIEPEPPK